jgi:adenylyltransferase/sulfurtransferase
MKRPLLPSHYDVWFEPPDASGDEALHIVSGQRSLKLKGFAFREFAERVVPLLDGSRSTAEIQACAADVFRPEDLAECLALLEAQGILVEAPPQRNGADRDGRMTPQLNLFSEMAPGEDLQGRLAAATVAVVGLGSAGPAVAAALAAAGAGTVRLLDHLEVTPADVYFTPGLGLDAVGTSRAARVAALVAGAAPDVAVQTRTSAMESEDDVRRAISGADYVACCLDAAQANLTFKLNRACLADGIRWIACALAGAEVVVGPAVHPGHSACYLCYRMRAVACAGNPEDAFAHERHLDLRRSDDSARRENLTFAAAIAGNLVANEVVKELTGLAAPSLVGRLFTLRLTDLAAERHTVLRKPGCPACFPQEESDGR